MSEQECGFMQMRVLLIEGICVPSVRVADEKEEVGIYIPTGMQGMVLRVDGEDVAVSWDWAMVGEYLTRWFEWSVPSRRLSLVIVNEKKEEKEEPVTREMNDALADNPVTFVIEQIRAEVRGGAHLLDAARKVNARYPRNCLEVMEIIGSWPSSERELNALQRVWP